MAQPRLNNVVATAHNQAEFTFDQAMDQTGEFLRAENYTVTGKIVALVSAPSATKALVTIEGKWTNGVQLAGAVSSALKNLSAETMNVLFLSRLFTPNSFLFQPAIASAIPLTTNKVRLNFSERLVNNAALRTPGNYAFVRGAGASAIYASKVVTPDEPAPSYVDLECSEMTNGGTYYATALNIVDHAGNPIRNDSPPAFVGLGKAPSILSVKSTSKNRVDVVFSEVMKDNPDIRDKNKYAFNNGLTVLAVIGVNGETISLATSDQIPGQAYQLTVSS